jgi:hypothetical protein
LLTCDLRGVGITATTAIFLGLGQRVRFLQTQPLPIAWDGFYYLQQIRYFSLHGENYYNHHWVWTAIAGTVQRVLGLAPESLYPVIVLGNTGLLTGLVAWLAWRHTAGVYSLVVAAIVPASNQIFYQLYGSLTQMTAFSLLLLSWVLLLSPAKPVRSMIGIGGLALAASMHVFVACLAVLIATFDCPGWPGRWPRFAVPGLFIAVAAGHFLTNPKPFLQASVFAHGRLPTIIPDRPYFTAAEYQEFGLIAVILMALLLVVLYRDRSYGRLWRWLTLAMAVFLPVWLVIWVDAMQAGSLSDRIAQTAVLLGCLPLAIAFGLRDRIGRCYVQCLAVVAAVTFSTQFLYTHSAYDALGPDMPIAALTDHADVIRTWLPATSPVLAPHGIQFRITYLFGNPAAAWLNDATKMAGYYQIVRTADHRCLPLTVAPFNRQAACLDLGSGWILQAVPPAA